MPLYHVLSTKQFGVVDVDELCVRADLNAYRENDEFPTSVGKGKILANLFYEPSTRTSSSFYSAMVRLGGHVIPINNVQYSSVAKGETLQDTIRTLQCYADLIVLRHSLVGAAEEAARVASVPIINAGDGVGEHPTQALLDLYTIRAERGGHLDGMHVVMMGDLLNGRTVKSLATLLRLYGATISWVSPPELRVPQEFATPGEFQTDDLHEVVHTADVLYLTRVQRERMVPSAGGNTEAADMRAAYDALDDATKAEYKHLIREQPVQSDFDYAVTPEHMARAKRDMILMHPLPRTSELPTELDSDPRAAYFRQMRYGLFMRMAVIEKVLEARLA